jgi:preprotein translocase subunit SecY
MIEAIKNIFKIKELKDRIVFTLLILLVERLGTFIVTPGVNSDVLAAAMQGQTGVGALYDLFTGGAFSQAAIFSCGIMPYISASIIIQLLGTTVPYFQRLQKEGEDGRRKISQMTRYGTLVIAAIQASGIAIYLNNLQIPGQAISVTDGSVSFIVMTVITMSAGTLLLMWLGEQITDRGIGNGISLIIFVGIVARLPVALKTELGNLSGNQQQVIYEFIAVIIVIAIIVSIVALTQGVRKIPIQFAKRVVGDKVYGGQSSFFPIKVNAAGVMPIIFAQAFMFLPETIFRFFPDNVFIQENLVPYFRYDHIVYWLFSFLLIVLFTYFYTAVAVNPIDISENLKKQNGFVPGIRPGRNTAEYIDAVLTRLTLPGSLFLGIISVVPFFLVESLNLTQSYAHFFGGTGILIIVGVALDTLQQIESHLIAKNYDGFLKSGRIQGRRSL